MNQTSATWPTLLPPTAPSLRSHLDVSVLGSQKSTNRELAKLCIYISYDEGATWPVRGLPKDQSGDKGVVASTEAALSIEPVNRSETFFLRTTQEAKQLFEHIGKPTHRRHRRYLLRQYRRAKYYLSDPLTWH